MRLFWWKGRARPKIRPDINKNMQGIGSFSFDAQKYLNVIKKEFNELQELLDEKDVMGQNSLKHIIDHLDVLMLRYEFFEEEVIMNGKRLKQIGDEILLQAKESGIDVKSTEQKGQWKYKWD